MKKGIAYTVLSARFLLASLFVLSPLVGCSKRATIPADAVEFRQENAVTPDESNEIILEVKEKYSAEDFILDDSPFSADVVDKYHGKTVIAPILFIGDVFYDENGGMSMYAKYWSDEQYMLKITPEHYAKIKTFNDNFDSEMYVVFRFESISPMLPELDAYFSFDLTSEGSVLDTDDDVSASLGGRVFCGTLVDIFKVQDNPN